MPERFVCTLVQKGAIEILFLSFSFKQCAPPPSPFLQAGCPSCRPANSVKALKANKGTLNGLLLLYKEQSADNAFRMWFDDKLYEIYAKQKNSPLM